jgi:hypothetical protein
MKTMTIPYRYPIDMVLIPLNQYQYQYQYQYQFLSLILFLLKRGVWGEKQRTTEDRRPETGKRKKTKSKKQKELWTDDALPGNNVEAEFIDHFGSFNGKNEKQRWQTLVECIGLERAQEIAAWAERKEIHMINRGGLMDSLETAAKKWTEKARPPESGGRSGKKTPEEIQARSMENIRKGLEMAFAQDEQHRSQETSPRIPCKSRDYHGFRHTDAIFKLERGSRLRWSLGYGGSAGDPGECVSRGAAAGRGVGGVFGDTSHGDASQGLRNSRPAGVLRKWRLVPRGYPSPFGYCAGTMCFANAASARNSG